MPICGWTLACVVWAANAADPPSTHSHDSTSHLANTALETAMLPSFALSDLQRSEPLTIDLGEVIRETTVDLRFKVVNDTDESVAMTSARSSCSCTEIDAWPVELKPEEAGEVIGSFHAPKRAGVTRTSDVSLRSADGLIGAVQVSAEVVDPVRSSIAMADDRFVIRLQSRDQTTFAVSGVEPALAYTLASRSKPSQQHTLKIDHSDWEDVGSPKRIAVLLDHPRQGHVVLSCADAQCLTPESAATPRRAEARTR